MGSQRGKYTSPEGSAVWEYAATTSCSLLIFSVSCVAGWNSPTLGILMGPDTPIRLTPSDASTLSSMMALGHALAPMVTMAMADRLGRKFSILAAGIPPIVSWGLIAVSKNIVVLFAARFIGGLSVGLILCIPPMYLGEIASVKIRGAMGTVCGIMMNAGILFMFATVPYFSVQTMACISLGIAAVSVSSVWFIPESPYFLAMVGRIDEAEVALEKLRGKPDVAEELELIKTTVNRKESAKRGSEEAGDGAEAPEKVSAVKRLFAVTGNRRALFINILFSAALQFGGYISVMVYGQIIFEKMNTSIPAHVCTMIIATLQLVCNILTACIIDRLGRRPLICVSGLISGTCVLSIGVYFYLMEYAKMDVGSYGLYAFYAMIINMVAINIGLMPLQMVIQSEILATEVKGLATSIIGVTSGVMATIGTKSYLMLAVSWGLGHCVPFFGFAAVIWICTALILKLLPETKGRTFLEIQRDLNA